MKKKLNKIIFICAIVAVLLFLIINFGLRVVWENDDIILGRLVDAGDLYNEVFKESIVIIIFMIFIFGLVIVVNTKFLNKNIIKSIEYINDRLDKITDGDFSEKIYIDTTPEFAELSSHLNNMKDSIATLIQNEKHQKEILMNDVQRADEENMAKSNFLASMSHDIRTPMNGILGMTAIAKSHLDDRERVEQCLDKINGAGSHLLSLINDILDLSKIESGKMNLEEEDFNLSDLMDNMVNMVTSTARMHGQELNVTSNGLSHKDVIGDSLRIQQVFMNIVGNAIKYTQDGGRIDVSISELPSNDERFGKYEFVCQDNGYGMSKETIDTLFKPFERSADTRIKNIQGTGLGMMITKNIVAMLDGELKVESELDKGSRFTVDFRVRLQDKTSKTSQSESKQTNSFEILEEKKFTGRRVLLVEDNELNREIATEILKMTGVDVEIAVNGREALDKFEQSDESYYDIILMDVQMPVMNGYEATAAIRSLERQDAKELPIVAMTANAFAEDVAMAKSRGMNQHVAKPIELPKLIAVMEQCLEG